MELAVFRAPGDGRGIGGGDIVGGLGGLRPDGARIFVISKEGVQVQVGRGGVSRPQVGSHSELPDAFRERVSRLVSAFLVWQGIADWGWERREVVCGGLRGFGGRGGQSVGCVASGALGISEGGNAVVVSGD